MIKWHYKIKWLISKNAFCDSSDINRFIMSFPPGRLFMLIGVSKYLTFERTFMFKILSSENIYFP